MIGGEDDLFTPVEHTDRITELLPDAVALRLPHCGHLGMIEHPEAVNEVLEDLLDRVRETARPELAAVTSYSSHSVTNRTLAWMWTPS